MTGPTAPDTDGEGPLLLHSLASFSKELIACLDAAAPRRIVEIGSETGGFTLTMADWAAANDAVLVTVDPEPAPAVRAAAEADPAHLEVVAAPSPWALEDLAPADAYVIDGDHNYWTVAAELRAAFAAEGRTPLVILHDVAWPCARRDFYYAPDRLPPEALHEHTFRRGVRPGDPGTVDGGFRGGGLMAVALEEGGERNGVLTAVEDFVGEHGGLELLRIPCIFGVGVLIARDAPWAERVRSIVAPLAESPVLELLERNRVLLFDRILDLQDETQRARTAGDHAIADLHEQIGRLQAENATLRLNGTPSR